jgi:phosphate-selective porin OprO and OprP
MKKLIVNAVLVLGMLTGTAVMAGAEEEAAVAPVSLEERLNELDQKVKVLERNRELDAETSAEQAKAQPTVFAGKDGFGIKTADGDFQIKFRGYVQADGRNFFIDRTSPLTDQFLVRRAVTILDGTFYKKFDFRFSPDFGGGKVQLLDAFLDARFFDELKLQAGKFKSPLGLEVLQSSPDLLFVERSLTSNLLPNYDVGFALHGDPFGGALTWSVGAFNGSPDGASTDTATGDDRTVAGRIFATPFKATEIEPLQGLGLGIAGSYGTETAGVALGSYKTPAQEKLFSYKSATVANGLHYRIVPQANWYYGPFGLYGEYVISAQDVKSGTAAKEVKNSAWQVAGSVLLTDDTATNKAVVPKRPFDPAKGNWGAVEVAARFHRLDVDRDAFTTFADPASSVRTARAFAAGVNWYLNRNVKAQLDYEQSSFSGGGAASKNRAGERVVLSRLQLAF